ncbi:TetR/AcrR family transcriptional regulator [Neobacillus muris]|uniref:TetR/AcrR family transcriptional regulator n=1 Tax=Neobacillus muris TaxID=2941334 RepID=UPI00203E7D42|nr:TetR/AcrR family transcriptional regulator C-terminal domain-containing protein [Neobacillus muris]
MPKKQTDKRVLRTKRLIRDMFTELMEKKGFEAVTVRDITESAKINRGTFYLHYQDKYDLLEKSEAEIFSGIEEIVQEITPEDALSFTNQNQPFPVIVKLFEYFKDNAPFLKALLGPKGDPGFQVKLKEMMKSLMHRFLISKLDEEGIMVPIDFLLSYICSAHVGVIQYWLETGMEKSPQELTLILAKMTLLGPGHTTGLIK